MLFDIAVLLAPTGLTGLYLLHRGMRRSRRAAAIADDVAERTRDEPPVFGSRRTPAPTPEQERAEAFRAQASASLGGVRKGAPAAPPSRAEPPVQRIEPALSRPAAPKPAPLQSAERSTDQGEIFHIDFDDDK